MTCSDSESLSLNSGSTRCSSSSVDSLETSDAHECFSFTGTKLMVDFFRSFRFTIFPIWGVGASFTKMST